MRRLKLLLDLISRIPLSAILLFVAGIMLAVIPKSLLHIAISIIGAGLVLNALISLALILFLRDYAWRGMLSFFIIVSTLALGIFMLLSPTRAWRIYFFLEGGYIAFRAGAVILFEILLRSRYRYWTPEREGLSRGAFQLSLAAVCLSLGIAILLFPDKSGAIFASLCGISLAIEGLREIISFPNLARGALKNEDKSGFIEAEYIDKSKNDGD